MRRINWTIIFFNSGVSFDFLAIDHTFNGFTGVITHLGCWENTRKESWVEESDLQAFLVFSQHPKWVIMPVNP